MGQRKSKSNPDVAINGGDDDDHDSDEKKTSNVKTNSKLKSTKGVGINDMLVDDVLLKIFSFLTVYEKLVAARTCKRWRDLIKDAHLWQTADFWNGSPSKETTCQSYKQKCNISANSELRILQYYTDSMLKKVYLESLNLDLMRYLTNNCPTLQTLSFLSSEQNIPHCDGNIGEFFTTCNFVLPSTLLELQLSFSGVTTCMSCEKAQCSNADRSEFKLFTMNQFRNTVLPNIIQCQNLRHVTLKMCNGISQEDVEILTSRLPNLQEIWLLTFTTYPDTCDTLEETLRRIVRNLPRLSSLRFMPVNRSFSGYSDYPPSYDIDDLLRDLCNRPQFRELRVRDAMFSSEAFTAMTRALDNMEELVLWNCNCVTDDVMQIIARDLPSLKVLELPFSRPYTDTGLRALKHHPSLATLNVFRSMLDVSFEALSTEAIFETLMTLPNLEQAGGLHWQSRDPGFQQHVEKLNAIKPNIRIEMS